MSTKLFIGGLSWGTTDESMRERFGEFGEVMDAIVVKDRETGRSRGFGFVTFADGAAADAAIAAMNDADFEGRTIRVDKAADRNDASARPAYRPRGGSSGGYGDRSSSGYGGERSSSGYGSRERSSGYGGERSSSGYGSRERSSGGGSYGSSERRSYGDRA